MSCTSRRGRASAARDPMDRFRDEWLGMVRPSLASMIADLAAAITGWFAGDPPASSDGTLGFVLTVLTTLTEEPRPLITLANLSLSIAEVYPPLPVADPSARVGRRGVPEPARRRAR